MNSLNRKLLRDLWHMRGQVFAIALVVMCGVATVVSSRTGYESLVVSRSAYYADYRFADLFAQLKRAPERLEREIADIPGVVSVSTRIVFDVTLDVPGLAEPATGRICSIPERRVPILNDLYIRRGRWVAPGRRDEVLVSEAFAEANQLEVGDSIGAILNGRWATLRIVGVALSPEYIYEIRGTDIFPDNKHFGVLWMSRDVAGPVFDMEGAFNDLALDLSPKASEPEVIARLDRLLEPYGGLGAYGRDEQISHRFISDEIRQNRVFGTILPIIFLGVAAFLLNVVLSRLIATQRDQIGVLKAFGYDHLSVSLHYLLFALVAVALGAVTGTALGLWLAAKINRLYVQFYRFPVLRYEPGAMVILVAVASSGLAAFAGALGGVRRAWRVPPAEAMRPEPPARFRAGFMETVGLQRFLAPSMRIIIRNIARRPVRAALSVLGIALATAILVLGYYFVDSVEFLATVQFRLVQREDMTLLSHDPLPARARYEIAHLPGVTQSEPFRVVPVRLRHEHRDKRVILLGLQRVDGLRRLVGADLHEAPLPPEGVVLTAKLAEILDVSAGDQLAVEVLEGSRPKRTVVVSALLDEMIGLWGYMDARALNRLMREGGTVSGSFLAVDSQVRPALYALLKRLPGVAGVLLRESTLESFEKTLGESMGIFTTILVVFAAVIAVAVVYNAARIALSERARELASLRVLGFTRREVALMLLGEQAILTVCAVPVGFLIGWGLCAWIAWMYQWELFRLPLIVTARTYGFGILVIFGAAVGSALLMWHRLARLDLVEVLKTRE
jgi:putative ABC transport system permease protein